MKKIQILLPAVFMITALTAKVKAQFGADNLGKNQSEIYASNAEKPFAGYKSMAKLTKASSRAVDNFKSTFKNDASPKWLVEKDAIVAKFTTDDIRTTVVYDKKGRWIHTIQVYDESKMPKDILASVKRSIYFDYNITLVHKIEEGDVTFYIVDLENGKEYKQVSVYEGEINLLEAFHEQ